MPNSVMNLCRKLCHFRVKCATTTQRPSAIDAEGKTRRKRLPQMTHARERRLLLSPHVCHLGENARVARRLRLKHQIALASIVQFESFKGNDEFLPVRYLCSLD